MTVTPLGYLFLGSALFGVLLAVGVRRRFAANGKPIGAAASLFFGFVLVTISTPFVMGSAWGGVSVYKMMTFPRFEATVIHFDSEWEEMTRTDSDGFSYTEDVLMHTPTLQFVDDTGQTVTQRGNIRSGKEPVIGDTVTVGYRPGQSLYVISVASIGLLTGLAVMMLILGYILAEVLMFVLGRKSKRLNKFGGILLGHIIIGGGMLGMLAGMLYGVYSYFQPGSDMPFGIMLLCLFFSLVLALAFTGMFFVGRKDRK
ncbi:hypothetical protein [Yoonia sp. BS5-3]|uniref:Uncharacterized protein n=1 Tax=Yoonia phaeophyticola TaxID=3137369 RepID=A0ABZ2V7G5_9RHOB